MKPLLALVGFNPGLSCCDVLQVTEPPYPEIKVVHITLYCDGPDCSVIAYCKA